MKGAPFLFPLKEILPLCSFSNKIRNKKGDWEKVGAYINEHSQVDISHSICPECAKDHYTDLDIYEWSIQLLEFKTKEKYIAGVQEVFGQRTVYL